MLYLEDNNTIKLTRGDTAYIKVPITNKIDGTEYVVQHDDLMVLTVKKDCKDSVFVFQKKVNGSNIFKILPEDTVKCEFTKYKYDVQLTLSTGDVFTVIEPAIFQIMQEVT